MKKILFVFSIVFLLATGCGNSSQPAFQGSNQTTTSPTTQATNETGSLNTSPTNCNTIISLEQLKTIVDDNNLVLGSSDSNPGQYNDHLVTCLYQNYDLKNPASAGKRIIGVNFSIAKYSDSNWQSAQFGLTNPTPATGLGSKAISFIYNLKSNSPAYFVTSSNNKYIFSVSENDVTNNSAIDSLPNTTENVTQEDQAEINIIKAIDTNLN